MSAYDPSLIWWSFPLAGFAFLTMQLYYGYIYSLQQASRISALTLIPYHEGGQTFDRSIRYQSDEVYSVLHEIDDFLKQQQLNASRRFGLNLCCEELMSNIAQHSHGHIIHHSFDVHIYSDETITCVAIKDGGKPFDPTKAGKMADKNIGSEGYNLF